MSSPPFTLNARARFPTIEEIREALGIADDSQDEAITATLAAVVALVESYLQRGIVRADEIEEIDPPDSRLSAVLLFRFPIASVASVTQDGALRTGYRVQSNSGILRWPTGRWTRAWQECLHDIPLIVSYTGGYPEDGWPADLLWAVMDVFYRRWALTGGEAAQVDTGGAIRSVAVDGMTVTIDSPTYAGSAFAESVIPVELVPVAAILDPYRVRRAGGV
jgi:hypothetical protein